MVALDRRGRAFERDALDHVGVERALREKLRLRPEPLGDGFRRVLEDLDERPPDDLPLLLRVFDAVQGLHKLLRRVDDDEVDVEVLAEGLLDLGPLVFPKQPGIDEHARQPVADGLVQEHGRDGRIDATAEPEDHVVVADLLLDLALFVFDKRGRRPVAPRTRTRW